MKRATGPGKIEERPEASTQFEQRITFSMFNFDVEDATLKAEHKKFLETLVAQVLDFRGVFATLRGLASRSGDDSFNQKLSEQRVAAARDFLLKEGIPFAKVGTSAGGERDAKAAGDSNGTENDRFRAVLVTFHFPTANRPPKFDRMSSILRNDGFDKSLLFEPPWVLVRPEVGFREVRLLNGRGLALSSTNRQVVEVRHPLRTGELLTRATAEPQTLRLQWMGTLGDAEIEARDSKGIVVARLRVSVLPKLTVSAAFHYVRNPVKGQGVSTARDPSPAREQAFIDQMDTIYLAQANIVFKQIAPGREVTVRQKMGPEVNSIGVGVDPEFDAVVNANSNRAARFNVFFVRDVETDAEGTLDDDGDVTDTVDGLTDKVGGRNCLLDDDPQDIGLTMAHEAGHCLGVDHDVPLPSTEAMLMHESSDGRFIPRIHALLMRRHVRR